MENNLKEAADKLNEISTFFNQHESWDVKQPYSLLSGQAGTILLQSMLYQGTKNEDYTSQIMDSIERISGIVENIQRPRTTFCSGLAGFGWLLMHLNGNNIIDMDADHYLDDLDQILEFELHKMLQFKNFDILHGAMGVGLYFIKRNKPDNVKKIIDALTADKQVMNHGIAWSRFDSYTTKEDIYDFGLAHGMAGTLYFLGKCYTAGIDRVQCKELIDGSVLFFMNNINKQSDTSGSFYPGMIPVKKYNKEPESMRFSRLAWCYGDLGILHTLLLISDWTADKSLQEKVLNMLLKVAVRKSIPETLVKDAGFCHGAAGNCYVFKNIYRLTGNEVFSATADYWLEQTLNFKQNEPSSVCGYLFHKGESGWHPETGVLSGLGGVGIVLADHNFSINHNWNECLFLS